jgi:hypothetical protein
MLAPLIGEMPGVDKTPVTCSEDGRSHFSAEVSAAEPGAIAPDRFVLCAQVDECRGCRTRT